jgi:hypothetical protein
MVASVSTVRVAAWSRRRDFRAIAGVELGVVDRHLGGREREVAETCRGA